VGDITADFALRLKIVLMQALAGDVAAVAFALAWATLGVAGAPSPPPQANSDATNTADPNMRETPRNKVGLDDSGSIRVMLIRCHTRVRAAYSGS